MKILILQLIDKVHAKTIVGYI